MFPEPEWIAEPTILIACVSCGMQPNGYLIITIHPVLARAPETRALTFERRVWARVRVDQPCSRRAQPRTTNYVAKPDILLFGAPKNWHTACTIFSVADLEKLAPEKLAVPIFKSLSKILVLI